MPRKTDNKRAVSYEWSLLKVKQQDFSMNNSVLKHSIIVKIRSTCGRLTYNGMIRFEYIQ